MNNYCRNCGEKLENNAHNCPKCNTEIFENRINVELKQKDLIKYKKKEKLSIILIITLYTLSYLAYYFKKYAFLSMLSSLLFLIATIFLTYVRITLNDSKKIKVMFNIFISIIIMYFLFILIIIITCSGAFVNCIDNL